MFYSEVLQIFLVCLLPSDFSHAYSRWNTVGKRIEVWITSLAEKLLGKAYKNWWKEECASLELLVRQGRMDLLYVKKKNR